MKRSVGRGTFVLVVSGIICKFFGALFRLPLTNVLGIEGIAIFQMVMSLYSLAIIFVSNGVTSSLAKLVASARARGEGIKAKSYLSLAIKYVLILAGVLGGGLTLFSKQIAMIQGIGRGRGYLVMIVLLPLGGLIGVYRGIIQGHENMTPTAISQIIEQVSRFAFGLAFAYVFAKKGIDDGVFGAFLGITISEALAFVYLQFAIKKKVSLGKDDPIIRREFFHAILPLSFSNGVIPLTHTIESLTIIPLLSFAGVGKEVAQKLYGLQTGMVGAVLSFPLLISLAVGMALLPKISFLSSLGQQEEERKMTSEAFSIMWAFLVPLVLGLTSLSKEVYSLVYPSLIGQYLTIAQGLTYITAISTLLAGVMQFLLSILQAKGMFKHTLCFCLIGGGVKILTLVIFSMSGLGIYAIPLSNTLLHATISICCMIKLYSVVKVDLLNLSLPLCGGFVMFLVVKVLISTLGGVGGVCLSILVGGVVYFLLTLPLWLEYAKPLINKLKKNKKRLEN